MIERLRRALARARHRRLLASMAGPKLLSSFAESYPRAKFVEIGANDGQDFDHLHALIREHDWRGVLVEPVPYVFARLQANYADVEGVALENAAIADRDGTLPFFHLREAAGDERATLPEFYDALGSFSKDAILTHAPQIPDLQERIIATEVKAVTFARLLADHGLGQVDLVVIDTEGYDHEIIKSIDFEAHGPRLLVYEHFHLSVAEREACAARLRRAGYATMEEGFDTFCLRGAESDDGLARAWRRLAPAVAGVSKHDEAKP